MHQDSEGHNGLIYPGLAQRMSAGTGILHSEKNDHWRARPAGRLAHTDPVHFVQMWVVPDENGIAPGYEQLDITDELTARRPRAGRLGHAAPTHESSAIRIGQRDAALFAARLAPGESVDAADAPFVHLYVARGAVVLEGAGALGTGRRRPDHRRPTASG